MDLVIATSNQHKLKEFKTLLQDFPLTILSLRDFPDIPAVVEDGRSFYENALKKALTVARQTDKITVADDSGIEVDALEGKPGVYSARFAGENATDAANNTKLLEELKGVPPDKRGACFKCVLVIAQPDGDTAFVEGECRGSIIHEPRGSHGFGYDPLFLVPEYNKTFSEITPGEKNKISHRARALRKLLEILPNYLWESKIDNPLEIGKDHGVVGGDDFIQWIKGKFSNKGKAEREQPALRELRREKKPEELIEHYAQMRKRFNTLNDQFLQKSK